MSLTSVLYPIYKRSYPLSVGDISEAQQAIERLEGTEPESVIRTLWSALYDYVEGVHSHAVVDRDLEYELKSAENEINDLEIQVDSLLEENEGLQDEIQKMEKELEALRNKLSSDEMT